MTGEERAAYDTLPHACGSCSALRRCRGHGSPVHAARLADYRGAVLANRQVATVLRSQGLNEHADRFAYRAQLCQRRVLRLQRHCLRHLGSLFLGLISGYGYRPMRSFATYVAVVLGFAALYFVLGVAGSQHTCLPGMRR